MQINENSTQGFKAGKVILPKTETIKDQSADIITKK